MKQMSVMYMMYDQSLLCDYHHTCTVMSDVRGFFKELMRLYKEKKGISMLHLFDL